MRKYEVQDLFWTQVSCDPTLTPCKIRALAKSGDVIHSSSPEKGKTLLSVSVGKPFFGPRADFTDGSPIGGSWYGEISHQTCRLTHLGKHEKVHIPKYEAFSCLFDLLIG